MPGKLRVLLVTFDIQMEPWELRYLRAAIANKAGWEHEMFHNHNFSRQAAFTTANRSSNTSTTRDALS